MNSFREVQIITIIRGTPNRWLIKGAAHCPLAYGVVGGKSTRYEEREREREETKRDCNWKSNSAGNNSLPPKQSPPIVKRRDEEALGRATLNEGSQSRAKLDEGMMIL